MAGKSAAGSGSIRKKAITRNGKTYTYWEGRVTIGYHPGTGKQIQKSVTGKTQKEVRQKLQEITCQLDAGSYIAPSKMTVGRWLDIWKRDYLSAVKTSTAAIYAATIENHIKPALSSLERTASARYTGLLQPSDGQRTFSENRQERSRHFSLSIGTGGKGERDTVQSR